MTNEIQNGPQTIEELQARFEALDKKKQEAKDSLARAEERLSLAKKNAKANFGSDDIAELEKKLEEWKLENEQKRAKYQQDLDAIEKELERVQADHQGTN